MFKARSGQYFLLFTQILLMCQGGRPTKWCGPRHQQKICYITLKHLLGSHGAREAENPNTEWASYSLQYVSSHDGGGCR